MSLKGGGETLNDPKPPSGDLHAGRQADSEGRAARSAKRAAISPSWHVVRVDILGRLQISVAKTGPDGLEVHSELDLASIPGLGPLAKAALISLVLNLKHGRTSAQLGEALDGRQKAPTALQSHVSAVRRTGLAVTYASGSYRVKELSRDQVDALQLEDYHHNLAYMYSQPGEGARQRLIEHADKALALWIGDPVPAHAYFRDLAALSQFTTYRCDILAWQCQSLILRKLPGDWKPPLG